MILISKESRKQIVLLLLGVGGNERMTECPLQTHGQHAEVLESCPQSKQEEQTVLRAARRNVVALLIPWFQQSETVHDS